MCGIAGWRFEQGAEPVSAVLEGMSDAIRHRGPDDQGSYRAHEAGVALAFRRLSIIDLSLASHQPMLDVDSGVVLAFNGEMYNFRELKQQLQGLGHTFASSGDSEVVLRSYLQWGVQCFDHFAGMFALAIWDPRSDTLHLARDPLGMKPLYYAKLPRGVAFASEVKAFYALPGFGLRPDRLGLRQYLEFGYVFDQRQTFLEGISKLAPGFRMEVGRDGEVRVHEFFKPPLPDPGDLRTEPQRVDELRDTLDKVTAQHLIADVPVGLLLSGGLDSSLIAALAARKGPLLTISMGFAESGIDERPQARAVSEYIGSQHLELLITPRQVMDEVQTGAWVFDDLFADWGTITTRLMYRQCREHGFKVVLVGEGADELFGGYDIFQAQAALGLWRTWKLYQKYAGRRHGHLFPSFRRIIGDYLEENGGDAFGAIRMFECRRQLPNQYVMKVDKASMAESIEARAPYLDRRVAELAYRTPKEWLLRDGTNKYLLRALGRRDGLLPDTTSQQRKFGGSIAASWMDDNPEFRAFARERLLDGVWPKRLGLDRAMRNFFDKGQQGYSFPHGLSIFRNLAWRLLLLELWDSAGPGGIARAGTR